MKVKTINSIEVTSLCNLACEYCPNRLQHKYRKTGHMEWETFERAIYWVRYFCNQGTQLELNLFGIGEPTIQPKFIEMIHYAKKILPFHQVIHFNTNGVTMTEDLARKIMDAGINHIDITGHSPYHTAKAIRIFRKLGIQGQISLDPITQPNN